MHHQPFGRINFRLTFFASVSLKRSWSNCPTCKSHPEISIESNSKPRHSPQIGKIDVAFIISLQWGKKFVCDDIAMTLFLKPQRKLNFLRGFVCLSLFCGTL